MRILLWLSIVLVIGTPPVAAGQAPDPKVIEAANQYRAIKEDWDKAEQAYRDAYYKAKTNEERKSANRLRPQPNSFATRSLKIADTYPGTYGAAAALYWTICHGQETPFTEPATKAFLAGPAANADLQILWDVLFLHEECPAASSVLEPLLKRVIQEPNHPRAGDLLVSICLAAASKRLPAVSICPPTGALYRSPDGQTCFHRACDLLASRPQGYCWRCCQPISQDADQAWAEAKLRAILAGSINPATKVTASFALASILRAKDEASQDEAEKLYGFVIEAAGPAYKHWQQQLHRERARENALLFDSEASWVESARYALKGIRTCGLGKPAPDVTGNDLEGKHMRLSDYRGKAVLLSFWASWCVPCMSLVPHERDLVARTKDKPFVLIGVNGDNDLAAARKAAADKQMTWRSFKNQQAADKFISGDWGVAGWPTLYLIDQEGIIRKRWVGAPPPEMLDPEVDRLVHKANRQHNAAK
jgi:thiol-disulfide isomerase/thioredoxin